MLTTGLLSIDWTGQEGFSFSQAYSDALLQSRMRQSLAKHGGAYQGTVIERENKEVHLVQSLEIQGNCTGFQVSTLSTCITQQWELAVCTGDQAHAEVPPVTAYSH